MTKEVFVRIIDELREAWIANKNYYNRLNNIGILIDDPPAFQFLDVALSALSEEIGDTYGYVQFFVFDMDWGEAGKIYDPHTNKSIMLSNANELYDYIQERNKK